jgi:aspartyl-tRNA synthetase
MDIILETRLAVAQTEPEYTDALIADLPARHCTLAGWVEAARHDEYPKGIVLRDASGTAFVQLTGEIALPARGSYVSIEALFRTLPDCIVAENPKVTLVVEPPVGERNRELAEGVDAETPEALAKRYLTLRAPCMQANLRLIDLIHRVASEIFRDNHFIYVDTPCLTRSVYEYTDHDFVVMAPNLWGEELAHLVQSPQLWKQMLMAGGVQRYFQFAKNFRGEPGGPTHLQEFTQIDAEMVTVSPHKIRKIMEDIICAVFKSAKDICLRSSFPEVDYARYNGKGPREGAHPFVWVLNAPIAKRNSDGRIVPSHHVMSLPLDPKELWAARSAENLLTIKGTGYDLELNGMEVGGGDLRITDPDLQVHVLRLYGLSDDQIEEQYGALLRAMRSGVPQHGGFALGLSRLAMALSGEASLNGVQAFPMDHGARSPLLNIPFKPKNGIKGPTA